MRAKEFNTLMWSFDAVLTDESVIVCPGCGQSSPIVDWVAGTFECDLEHEHETARCPRCLRDWEKAEPRKFQVLTTGSDG